MAKAKGVHHCNFCGIKSNKAFPDYDGLHLCSECKKDLKQSKAEKKKKYGRSYVRD